MAKKEEVAEVLKIILDGLTAGESTSKEKKLLEQENQHLRNLVKVMLFYVTRSNSNLGLPSSPEYLLENVLSLFQSYFAVQDGFDEYYQTFLTLSKQSYICGTFANPLVPRSD